MNDRNAVTKEAAPRPAPWKSLTVLVMTLLIGGAFGARAIFGVLWVTVLPAFGLLYLLGWLR